VQNIRLRLFSSIYFKNFGDKAPVGKNTKFFDKKYKRCFYFKNFAEQGMFSISCSKRNKKVLPTFVV
jgi:hypothetical protein